MFVYPLVPKGSVVVASNQLYSPPEPWDPTLRDILFNHDLAHSHNRGNVTDKIPRIHNYLLVFGASIPDDKF